MKLWDKGQPIDKKIEEFTIGKDKEIDPLLAKWDVIGSLAHCKMLSKIGLLGVEEEKQISEELKIIYNELAEGKVLSIEDGIEDIHSQVELILTRKLGDIGKKIHSGRSRNDQVLTDLKLFFRDSIKNMAEQVRGLFTTLQELSETHKDTLMPGYTHMQVAMPSSFGMWFGSYAESLSDDMHMLLAAFRISNQNPLGSAAGYGSSFPLDREYTTRLLGFASQSYNSAYAQMGRGKTEKTLAFAMAGVAATIGKMAMDICLYNGQNFGFFKFPDELTTGSSIMPHKKNPDVFELIRAKSNKIMALPYEISLITGNLPAGYHRDLQVIKENVFPTITELLSCLDIMNYAIKQIQINKEIVNDPKYDYLFTVEEVNKKVLEGKPFRDAYKEVGIKVNSGNYTPDKTIHHTHDGSIGNLCNGEIKHKMEKVYKQFRFEEIDQTLEQL
ncbi:MAG: argininosuccinate lyase, partial [Cyclobacteriaceae bacterium]|nr:argininosuccinate lyase [Cyclobacteriaceae bacterium]